MLQLDGTAMPILGGSDNSGVSAGLGAAVGAVVGSAINGNGLFGNNNRGYNGYNDGCNSGCCGAYQGLQNQIDNVGEMVNQSSLSRSFDQTQGLVASNGQAIANLVNTTAKDIATAAYTTLTSVNGLGRDVTAAQNQAALQQLNSFNQQTTTMLQGFNSNAMQIQNATNQIISQGTTNAATNAANFCQLSREMAECCCDIKCLINKDGDATRALINDLNVQNLRDQLAAANNKVSNNEQNQYLLNTILHHYTPTPTPVVV